MSEIKVNSIKGVGASTAAITVNNSDGTCTANISNRPNRNLLAANGDHRIAQRGTAAVTVDNSGGFRCVDRWKTDIDGSSGGDFSHAQSTDVPDGQGFTNSSKLTTVTQVSQPGGTTNKHQLYYQLEKQDVAHLAWGTSSAKTCTLSFWVKGTVTGSYPVYFHWYGSGNANFYYTNYTISSANTWEKKTITLTGATSGGTVSGTTDVGLRIEWGLGYGSGFETGTLNEWTTSDVMRTAAGSVYLPENAGASFYLTGCQFEIGSTASDYEFLPFGQELALCQRYFFSETGDNADYPGCYTGGMARSGHFFWMCHFPVAMRTNPTYTGVSGSGQAYGDNDSSTFNNSAAIVQGVTTTPNPRGMGMRATSPGSLTDGHGYMYRYSGDGNEIRFDAEL